MNAVRAEWTKLRTVPRWLLTMALAVVLTVGVGVLGASGSVTDANEHPNFVLGPDDTPVSDELCFVHRTVTGDATLTVEVTSLKPITDAEGERPGSAHGTQAAATPWTDTAAGITLKAGTTSGSSYVSVLLTGSNGVRMQSDFVHDAVGSASSGTRWLRLDRSGNAVTGYESADGTTWQKIATMTPEHLPVTAEIGVSVESPATTFVGRGMGGASVGAHPTAAVATFAGATPRGEWTATQVVMPIEDTGALNNGAGPARPVLTEDGDTMTVVGTGKVGPQEPDDDIVESTLLGVIPGALALICLGVLFGTSEYRRGLIRTTFAATPRRGPGAWPSGSLEQHLEGTLRHAGVGDRACEPAEREGEGRHPPRQEPRAGRCDPCRLGEEERERGVVQRCRHVALRPGWRGGWAPSKGATEPCGLVGIGQARPWPAEGAAGAGRGRVERLLGRRRGCPTPL